MRLRKYKKFSESGYPDYREISFMEDWNPEYQGRKLRFLGDIEDAEVIENEDNDMEGDDEDESPEYRSEDDDSEEE